MALAFYKTAIGAEVNGLRRWKDSPDAAMKPVPGFGEKVTNASSRSGDTAFMANDGPGEAHAEFKGMTLTIEVADGMEAERVFTA